MTYLPEKLAFALIVVVALLSVWRPGRLSQTIGEVSPGAVQARPLVLVMAAFFLPALLPGDSQSGFGRAAIAVCVALLGWIAYRANPDSWPIVGSRSRLERIGALVLVALVGAIAGAVLFAIIADANLRGQSTMRVFDAVRIGAALGPGGALAIWERRANNKLLAQQSASAE